MAVSKSIMSYNKGLTLIEILLSLAIIGLIAGFSAPVYQSFMVRNDLDIATGAVAQVLRYAQTQSQAMHGDSSWGVHIGGGNITLFKGASYASRDTDYDEETSVPSTISASGLTEIVFDVLTGAPQSTGTLTLTSVNGDTRIIFVTSKGVVVHNKSLSEGNWNIVNEYSSVDIPSGDDGQKIQVSGVYSYVITAGSSPKLLIYNISNPASPVLTGSLSLSANPLNIFMSGSYVYIASSDNASELQIVSVSNPASPALVGVYDASSYDNANGVYVLGGYAYLVREQSSGADDFLILDISNPTSPSLVGSAFFAGSLYEVVVSGSYAFVASASNTNELRVINISNPTTPVQATSLDFAGGEDSATITLDGSQLLISNGGLFHIVNITNPLSPSIVGTLNTTGSEIFDITLENAHGTNGHTYAFLVSDSPFGDFIVVDITNPVSPSNISSHNIVGTTNMSGVAYSSFFDKIFISTKIDTQELLVIAPN